MRKFERYIDTTIDDREKREKARKAVDAIKAAVKAARIDAKQKTDAIAKARRKYMKSLEKATRYFRNSSD